MSGSRRGVIADSLNAARNVRPWLRTGELGMPESKVWQALRGTASEPAAVTPGPHPRADEEPDARI